MSKTAPRSKILISSANTAPAARISSPFRDCYCYDYYVYYYGTPYSSSPGLGHGRFCRAPCGSVDTPPADGLCLVGGGAL